MTMFVNTIRSISNSEVSYMVMLFLSDFVYHAVELPFDELSQTCSVVIQCTKSSFSSGFFSFKWNCEITISPRNPAGANVC